MCGGDAAFRQITLTTCYDRGHSSNTILTLPRVFVDRPRTCKAMVRSSRGRHRANSFVFVNRCRRRRCRRASTTAPLERRGDDEFVGGRPACPAARHRASSTCRRRRATCAIQLPSQVRPSSWMMMMMMTVS